MSLSKLDLIAKVESCKTAAEAEGRIMDLVDDGSVNARLAMEVLLEMRAKYDVRSNPGSREACYAPLTALKQALDTAQAAVQAAGKPDATKTNKKGVTSPMPLAFRTFKTGSVGWFYNGKVQDGLGRTVQVNINLTVANTKGGDDDDNG